MAKVVLPDGKNVDISSVLLNKEQNINVSKTYVTTVKKAVTKVSGDFYKVTDDKKEEPASQILEPITPSTQQPLEAPKIEPILPVESIQSVGPAVSPAPVVSLEPISKVDNSSPKLFFDGSKETNLNMALGEVSEEKTMTTESEGVQALRQFGSDEPVLPPQETVLPVQEDVKTLTRSKGFANNKFFMVIAIAFFVAACVFLGYEAFQYFQIAG